MSSELNGDGAELGKLVIADPVPLLRLVQAEVDWDLIPGLYDECCEDTCDPVIIGTLRKSLNRTVSANGARVRTVPIVEQDDLHRTAIIDSLSACVSKYHYSQKRHEREWQNYVLLATSVLLHDSALRGDPLWQAGIIVAETTELLVRRTIDQQIVGINFFVWMLNQRSLDPGLRALSLSAVGLMLGGVTASVLRQAVAITRQLSDSVVESDGCDDTVGDEIVLASIDSSADSTRVWARVAKDVLCGDSGLLFAVRRALSFFEADLTGLWP